MAAEIHILHFNDVYEVKESANEPVGGAARFVTAIKEHTKNENTLCFFSGDVFNPRCVIYGIFYFFYLGLGLPLLLFYLS